MPIPIPHLPSPLHLGASKWLKGSLLVLCEVNLLRGPAFLYQTPLLTAEKYIESVSSACRVNADITYKETQPSSEKNQLLGEFSTSLWRLPPATFPEGHEFHPHDAYPSPQGGPTISNEADSVKYCDYALLVPLFRLQ